jgi:anti-sigma factor RsiW
MSSRRHVSRDLPAYCEGALSESESEKIRGHLARCSRCRRRADEIAAGDSLAQRLTPVSLPSHRSVAIRRSLVEGPSAQAEGKPRGAFAMVWKLAAALAGVLGFLWFALARGPNVQVERASAAAAEFEELALAVHTGLASGRAHLEVEASSVPEVKRWLREHAGLSASLAASRPPEEKNRYLLRGATAVPGDGFTAAAIAYSVGGQPVTLLTAREEDAPDSPRWGLLGKRVRYRVDSRTGSKTLTWTNSGQAYALVSDLPQMGQQACLVCHTDPTRRRTIEALGTKFPR